MQSVHSAAPPDWAKYKQNKFHKKKYSMVLQQSKNKTENIQIMNFQSSLFEILCGAHSRGDMDITNLLNLLREKFVTWQEVCLRGSHTKKKL